MNGTALFVIAWLEDVDSIRLHLTLQLQKFLHKRLDL